MVITFKSPVAGDTTYVGPIGERFLKMLGRSKQVPGAMLAEDVPGALEQFRSELRRIEQQEQEAIEASQARSAGADSKQNKENQDSHVSIGRRAHPLIELLEKSAAAECEVIWE